MQKEMIIVIDLKGTKGLVTLVGAMTVMLLVLFLALPAEDGVVTASEMSVNQSTGMRQFYLTIATTNGAGALTACAEGYHFASLWEIADPTNLKYNTSLGYTRSDSGQGPPADVLGWVRTGYVSSPSATAGMGNCEAWSNGTDDIGGSYAYFRSDWSIDQHIGVWTADTTVCWATRRVWCIED